ADVLVEVRAVDRVDHGIEAGLAGEEDLGGRGQPAVDDLEELDSFHAGHDLVGDHDGDRLALAGELVEQRHGLVAGPRGGDLALVSKSRAELGTQHAQHALLVVDTQDDFAPAHELVATTLRNRELGCARPTRTRSATRTRRAARTRRATRTRSAARTRGAARGPGGTDRRSRIGDVVGDG